MLTVTRLSANFPRRIPARIPAEIPITISMMIAMTASLIVVGKRIGQFVGHRVSVERLAQITLKHIAHVEEVLDHQRLVQVVLLPEGGHVARRTRSFTAPPLTPDRQARRTP